MRRAAVALLLASWAARPRAWNDEYDSVPQDSFLDDNTQAIARVRERLAVRDANRSGVLLVTGPREAAWSSLTISIWRAYCERHGFGFFLQEEPLNTDFRFEWSKPRVLIELLPRVKWKYVFMVDANSLPVNLGRSWDFVVKEHMRHRRYAKDRVDKRLVFCPWECEEEYEDPYMDGACYGPQLSGCVFAAKKATTEKLVRTWYAKRLDAESQAFGPEQGLTKAFHGMKEKNFDEVFYRDVQKDLGKMHSKFMVTFGLSQQHGWNMRDQIHEFLQRHKELGAVVNKHGEHKRSEL